MNNHAMDNSKDSTINFGGRSSMLVSESISEDNALETKVMHIW